MGIRNNLLGVGSAGITTETGIIVGAATIEIALVVHRITWRPDRRPAAGIVCREKGNIIGAAAAKNALVAHRIACRPDRSAAAARAVRRRSAGIIPLFPFL